MSKIKKIASVIERWFIWRLDGLNNRLFTNVYWKYLRRRGVAFTGRPNYISSSAYLDGQGLDIITIGKDAVISREAMLLTHDYSVETALHAIGLGTEERSIKVDGPITIGDNSFIGARASLLPGTTIGRDCIVGACAVVKGDVPDGSVVVGCPARIIKRTEDIGRAMAEGLGQDANGSGGVFAVIVTYNPDLDRLRENIGAVEPQVGAVLVYDNGSDDARAISALEGGKVSVRLSEKNCGLAVALNSLCRSARGRGAVAVLVLDQDSVASMGMVSELRSELKGRRAIVAPVVIDRNRDEAFVASDSVTDVPRAINSGSLLDLEAWALVGGYDEGLFVDWVDNEFCDRLRSVGFSIASDGRACILHEMGRQERFARAPGIDGSGRRSSRHEYSRQNYPAWRWRDRARAQAITCSKYRGTPIGREERRLFLRTTLLRALVLERGRAANLSAICDGWIEGRAFVGKPSKKETGL